jgi:hypothetical protein
MKRFGLSFLAAGALALSAGAAQAFTFTDQNGNTGAAQGYVDLDTSSQSRHDVPSARLSPGQPTTLKSGNTSVQFGGGSGFGSFNQRYNSNNLFDPYAREGR